MKMCHANNPRIYFNLVTKYRFPLKNIDAISHIEYKKN